MKIPIIKESALEYWLDGTDRYYYHAPELHSIGPKYDFKIDEAFAKNLSKEYNLTLPLHLMVPETHRRNKQDFLVLNKWIKNLPNKSFVKLKDRGNSDEEVFVACPELTFVQMTNLLSLPEAVYIGNMLCATYVLDNEEVLNQRKRIPITTVNKIKRYIKKMDGTSGVKKARAAIKFVVDNCNSPREAELAAIAMLPIKYGGYGMLYFEMNGEVVVKNEYINGLGRKTLKCDMVWEKEKVVLEYESNMTHLEKEQHKYDKKRTTALVGSNYKVIYITNEDINTFSKIDDMFFAVRKILHQRRNQKDYHKYFEERYVTYNQIFRNNYFKAVCYKKYSLKKKFK